MHVQCVKVSGSNGLHLIQNYSLDKNYSPNFMHFLTIEAFDVSYINLAKSFPQQPDNQKFQMKVLPPLQSNWSFESLDKLILTTFSAVPDQFDERKIALLLNCFMENYVSCFIGFYGDILLYTKYQS